MVELDKIVDQNQKDLCNLLIGSTCRGRLLRFHQLGTNKVSWWPVFDIEQGRVRTLLHQLRQNDVGDNVWKGATSEQGGIRFWPTHTSLVPNEKSCDQIEKDHDQCLIIGKMYELTITNWNVFRESVFKYDTGLAWSVVVQPVCSAR